MDSPPTKHDKLAQARHRFRRFRHGVAATFRKDAHGSGVYESPSFTNLSLGIRPKTMAVSTRAVAQADAAEDTVFDGAGEREARKDCKPCVAAIFIHAGAGYHSTTNEHIHLAACNEAARLAMRTLRAGGSAVDAVEIAIRVLEDKEITNAGYGSNLSLEGVVECDATVVDHLGRSGAVGAAAQIKNPIHLARIILDLSTKPLTLRRVPPNLLVGQGATEFAWEHGIPIAPHDALVSQNAQDRFLRWREDLRRAEGRLTPSSTGSHGEEEQFDLKYDARAQEKTRRDHTQAILNSTWNEGQPDSPAPRSPGELTTKDWTGPSRFSPAFSPPSITRAHASGRTSARDGHGPLNNSPTKRPKLDPRGLSPVSTPGLLLRSASGTVLKSPAARPTPPARHISDNDGATSPLADVDMSQMSSSDADPSLPATPHNSLNEQSASGGHDEDMITDTVGAIAIDIHGRIAAGSSSGGIGMKHRGRIGPAALVGVGSAVLPADPQDLMGVSVAAVTSGTGEHMATTMASQKCAERLYHNTKRGRGGGDVPAMEEEALQSFVETDFMGHRGVRDSISAGAIGVMAVKQTRDGYYFYFAHNTDSFALASMASTDREPRCVMSRIKTQGRMVQGGRKIRVE